MSREDVIAVAVRLFAIYVLFSILKSIPSAAQLLSAEGGLAWAILYAAILAACALFCAFLWFFPLSVARRLLPAMREPRSEQVIGEPIALSPGLTLMGVWLLATSLVDATYWLTLIIRSRQVKNTTIEWPLEQIASVVATAVQLLLSLWLIFGSAGIRRLVYKFRYGA